MFFKIGVFKNFANFTEKHPCWSLFLACNFIKKRLQHRHCPLKFAKFLRTPFFITPTVAVCFHMFCFLTTHHIGFFETQRRQGVLHIYVILNVFSRCLYSRVPFEVPTDESVAIFDVDYTINNLQSEISRLNFYLFY